DLNRQSFELIIDTLKVQELLEQCNHKELSQENVLLALSLINVCVIFNPQNKHIRSIVINHIENELNNIS
ncbi:unnamed protein product, partial [Rotaria sordida]